MSKWFQFDWQYVLRAGRLPAVKPIAAVVVAFPAFGDLTAAITEETPGYLLIWLGSVASLLAFVFAWIRCPPMIREYERFKDFEEAGHSHRWIGWLFYLSRKQYTDTPDILQETCEKVLAVPEAAVHEDAALARVFAKLKRKPRARGYRIHSPSNIDRDLYVGFWLDGKPYVIPLREGDTKVAEKVKELFWIIETDLLKSRPLSRFVVWLLYGVTLLLFSIALLMNLASPIEGLYDKAVIYFYG